VTVTGFGGGRVIPSGDWLPQWLVGIQPKPVFNAAPLDVVGIPVVELAHSSDNPHADLFGRISEVDPKGRSRNVCGASSGLSPVPRRMSSGSSWTPWRTGSPRATAFGC
jgi:hypothetical protein